ncbi:STAS domain-containing protein [Nocardioides sp.]|uniref:STAS domain-containing protein n=1 Tax=Nocardioides sp. TaxID=35761 RepID=UPI0027173558|nr:STAS domain-containing protein [Nocardioides sp.]MDO9457681.1 STAS domain-containing protein [Nocardioides sp.]
MEPGPFAADFDASASVLTVTGEIDENEAVVLRDAISAHSADYSRDLVVDLTGVLYLPSVAVGVLAKAHKQSTTAGHPIDLLAAEATIAQRVLQVCALPHRTS